MVLVPDNATSMTSRKIKETLSDLNILAEPPAAKDSWAHGLVERSVQKVKDVASKIALSNKNLSPQICIALATHALNATEFVQGYTPMPWAYGRQYSLSEEGERCFQHVSSQDSPREFTGLLRRRLQAEDIARKVKASRTLSKLKKTKVRQPLQTFEPMDLVKI